MTPSQTHNCDDPFFKEFVFKKRRKAEKKKKLMYLFLYIDHGYPHLSVRHKKNILDLLMFYTTSELCSHFSEFHQQRWLLKALVQLCESFMNETKCADVTEHSTVRALE